MTTDRTAAPPRSTALHERSPAAAGQKAAPADAFSALLGAVAPRTEEAPRKPQERRDDSPSQHDVAQSDAPLAPAPVAQTPAPEAPVEPETPVLPSLFALQLASPLPPAVTPAPVPTTEPIATTPALPAFAPAQVQAPITGVVPATGEPVALPASELPQTAPAAPVQPLPVLGGLIPASALAPEAAVVTEQAAVPAQPQPQPLPQVPTAPAADATPEQVAIPNANTGQTQSDAQPQEQPNTAAPAPAAAPQQAKPAEAPAAVTAPAPQPVAAPAAPAAPTPTPTLERAVPLYRAVETTGLLLHVAAERGVTHARLNLKPVELGGIEVRLQSTPLGVSAQLVADSPEAARMLTQAGDDLRRQLAERDVTLLSLDVSTSSEQRHENTAGGFGAFGDDNYRPGFGSSQRTGGSTAETADAAPAGAETTLVLPDGVLVDVLA
jgi:flagellar hook-length control protein FliK